jgi:hypothetical protein
MKTNIILILISVFTQMSFAQETKTLEFNFFDFIKSENVSLNVCDLVDKMSISYFRSGFDIYETNKNGTGIFFAIPQKEFGMWKKEDVSNLKRDDLWKNRQAKITNAKEFLSLSKDTLLTYFDLYVFYVKQNDIIIEGSYITDDGQLIDDYYVKDNATIYTYTYKNKKWVEIKKEDRKENNVKTYGQNTLNKILKKRF